MTNSPRSRNPALGALAAVVAAVLWGFAFIALKWAYAGIGPVWLTVLRFAAAFALALPVLFLSSAMRRAVSWTDAVLALPAGLILGLCSCFRPWDWPKRPSPTADSSRFFMPCSCRSGKF